MILTLTGITKSKKKNKVDLFLHIHFLDNLNFFFFTGKDQVSLGIVPANHPYLSSQSSRAVYTIAVANCGENRYDCNFLPSEIHKHSDDFMYPLPNKLCHSKLKFQWKMNCK